MASNQKYEYIGKISDNLKCELCKKPFLDPLSTPCKHMFCGQCINDYLQRTSVCPLKTCGKPFIAKELQLVPNNFIHIINELGVKCIACGKNTDLTRGSFDQHINHCPQIIVKCPATNIRCPWEGARDQMTEHLEVCMFYKLQSVLTELMETNQQQRSQIEQLVQRLEQQETKNQQQYEIIKTQFEELHSQHQRFSQEITALVDQRYTELKNIQSKEQSEYEGFKKEVTSAVEQRCIGLNKQLEAENECQRSEMIPISPQVMEVKKEISNSKQDAKSSIVSSKVLLQVTGTRNITTVVGGQGFGNDLKKLSNPLGIYVDDDQTVFIADCNNHRIMEWRSEGTIGRVAAGGKGGGSRVDQLHFPTDVVVDKPSNSIIICDSRNRRVMKCSLQDPTDTGLIIENINCYGLAIDNEKSLYVSDSKMHEVRCYRSGETTGTVVAGGNGEGDRLDQLNEPRYVFVDQDHAVYVTDYNNHRVMRWAKGEKKGEVVAGGQYYGNGISQLHYPQGLFVDRLGNIYVADLGNHRLMRWYNGVGTIIMGNNHHEEQANQLHSPTGLSMDQYNNIYVADGKYHRVQRFTPPGEN